MDEQQTFKIFFDLPFHLHSQSLLHPFPRSLKMVGPKQRKNVEAENSSLKQATYDSAFAKWYAFFSLLRWKVECGYNDLKFFLFLVDLFHFYPFYEGSLVGGFWCSFVWLLGNMRVMESWSFLLFSTTK